MRNVFIFSFLLISCFCLNQQAFSSALNNANATITDKNATQSLTISTLPEYLNVDIENYFFWEGMKKPAFLLWVKPTNNFYLYSHYEYKEGSQTNVTVLRDEYLVDNVDILYPTGTPIPSKITADTNIFTYKEATPILVILPKDTIGKRLNVRLEGVLCSDEQCIPVRSIINFTIQDPETLPNVRSSKAFTQLAPALQTLLNNEPGRAEYINAPIPTKVDAIPPQVSKRIATTERASPPTKKTTMPQQKALPTKKTYVPPTATDAALTATLNKTQPLYNSTTPYTTPYVTQPQVTYYTPRATTRYYRPGDPPPMQSSIIDYSTDAIVLSPQDYGIPQKAPSTVQRPSVKPPVQPSVKKEPINLAATTEKVLEFSKEIGKNIDENPDKRLWDFTPKNLQTSFEVATLSKALLFAFIAGFILNLMPCVFPVLTLKFSSFLVFLTKKKNDDDEQDEYEAYEELILERQGIRRGTLQIVHEFRMYNVFFILGLLTFFTILAAGLYFTNALWGKIFQIPSAIFILSCIVFALALSVFNVFSLPILSVASKDTQNKNLQAFNTGILTTILATPCSTPLFGGVLAWLIQQPLEYYALVLGVMGLGMALPYCIFVLFPRIILILPKPGKWNVVLEQLVGFFLLATTLYLLSLLPVSWLIPSLISLFILAVALWLWGTFTGVLYSNARNFIIRLWISIFVICAILYTFQPSSNAHWQTFSEAQFNTVLGTNPVVVQFTADWCPNCKLLEKTVLTPQNITKLQQKYNAYFMKVDLTRPFPEGERLLKKLNSNSIPLLAVFPKGKAFSNPIVLRDIYTYKNLSTALQKASQ